jgi:hypothetical protein
MPSRISQPRRSHPHQAKRSATATRSATAKTQKPATGDKRRGASVPPLQRDPVWDAFERDDETLEPQPEYGDLWGDVDDEAE